jgi:hypothetical protein
VQLDVQTSSGKAMQWGTLLVVYDVATLMITVLALVDLQLLSLLGSCWMPDRQ